MKREETVSIENNLKHIKVNELKNSENSSPWSLSLNLAYSFASK